ncbi:MAG: hypothetical protein AYP45_12650 [Candidatus Brocadia carolinensis]|uniref:Uncharacterized protein n=1 Tax=Candidatus Brocadia carolinensis TaxID=1004156 RepID=A0A1V4ARU0_9BACT|nr:MAG: hypothetical protein AYP45_12650 [Candidatus Brocadia caroliniensis]
MINKTTHNMGLEEEGKGIKSLFMTNSQVGWLSETKPNIFFSTANGYRWVFLSFNSTTTLNIIVQKQWFYQKSD